MLWLPCLTGGQSLPCKIPFIRESLACWLQLPLDLCFRFTIDGQVDASKPPFWDRIWRDVRARQKADNKRNMDVKE